MNVWNKTAFSPEMAIRIAKTFGRLPEAWYKMQSAYDIAQAKKKT